VDRETEGELGPGSEPRLSVLHNGRFGLRPTVTAFGQNAGDLSFVSSLHLDRRAQQQRQQQQLHLRDFERLSPIVVDEGPGRKAIPAPRIGIAPGSAHSSRAATDDFKLGDGTDATTPLSVNNFLSPDAVVAKRRFGSSNATPATISLVNTPVSQSDRQRS